MTEKKDKFEEGFYGFLKEEIGGYKGKFDKIIYHVPEVYELMVNLLEENLEKEYKLMVAAALGYFVAPRDVIPEEIYGPYGYLDDLFICAYVLLKIKEKYGWEIIERNWNGVGDIQEILPQIYEDSKKAVGDKEKEVLEYVGLK